MSVFNIGLRRDIGEGFLVNPYFEIDGKTLLTLPKALQLRAQLGIDMTQVEVASCTKQASTRLGNKL